MQEERRFYQSIDNSPINPLFIHSFIPARPIDEIDNEEFIVRSRGLGECCGGGVTHSKLKLLLTDSISAGSGSLLRELSGQVPHGIVELMKNKKESGLLRPGHSSQPLKWNE